MDNFKYSIKKTDMIRKKKKDQQTISSIEKLRLIADWVLAWLILVLLSMQEDMDSSA